MVDLFIQTWQTGQWKSSFIENQPHEAKLLKLDISKAINELNWKPKLNSLEAVKWTSLWYKESPESQAEFTFEQIKSYMAL